MSSDDALIDQFVGQALDDSVRSILKDAFDERLRPASILIREFEFNCFDVTLDFERGIVRLQDVLSAGENSFLDISICDFIAACGLRA